MPNNFFTLPEPEQAALIEKAANQLGMPAIIIEKDIWVCWLLEKIFSLPTMQMAFRGGTSLSKVFNLIKRFSEDCDISVDYHNFRPDLDLENTTRTQIKERITPELKNKLKEYISETVLPFLKNEINKSLPKGLFEITLNSNGEELRFYYPSAVTKKFSLLNDTPFKLLNREDFSLLGNQNNYLKDHVFIEFGARNSTEPCEKYPLKTYLSDVIDIDLGLPTPLVNTLSPVRTFFEKLTLIHVECYRDNTKPTPDRYSRHWYDVYMLNNSWVGKEALSHFEILENVVEHKKAFFHYSFVDYDDCLSGKLRLIPNENYLKNLEKDYTQMINAGMFNETPPLFKDIISELLKLERNINEISKS